MTRQINLRRTVIIVLWSLSFAVCAQAVDEVQNIILIEWNGAQRDHVNEAIARGELPNLQKLAQDGAFVKIDIEGLTDHQAGLAQVLTGYYPEVTGVYSNRKYQLIPKGLTIFERLEKHFGPDKIVTCAVICKRAHVTRAAIKVKVNKDKKNEKQRRARNRKPNEEGAARIKNAKKYRLVPGKPYFHTKDGMDLFESGFKTDKKVCSRAIELLEKHKSGRFFFFVHFADVDAAGHKNGENSKGYNDALISNDLWTGKIIDKLRELGLYDKTLIYITADHGFDEDGKNHSNATYVFCATNDRNVSQNGRRQDITPTILDRFDVDLTRIEPKLDGCPLNRSCDRPEIDLELQRKANERRSAKSRRQAKELNKDIQRAKRAQRITNKAARNKQTQ